MARPNDDRRWAATRIASLEARRRAKEVSKVVLIVLVTIMATLIFTGHQLKADCLRAVICIERER